MKAYLLLALCLSVRTVHAAFLHPIPQQESDFLAAVRQVESGDHYDCPPGPAGELGAYQFRREVWSQYTQAEFTQAQTPGADEVAAQHYSWIVSRLRARSIPVSAWNVAAAWNAGLSVVLKGRIPASTCDYADRVSNLIDSQVASRPAPPPIIRLAAASRP